ncbi:hypothetical protein EIP91_009630 [Steccherinum ochraceum]|uniref:Enoyl reductase (ER) domain-containing protein n=1 Tax=Steccherinum ochraceum TaxID=92696 RepID=A0A4R0RE48_9APHY|nr:hypothetical protein EIP91_009630 [Steccherinum ochraceum]
MSMALPATQNALWIVSPKGPWSVGLNGVPTPGQGEVLIRIESTALNPVDWKEHDYDHFILRQLEYPVILGTDSAGIVVAVGDSVQKVNVGDRVLHQGISGLRQATFQEYTIASEDFVAEIPSQISFDEASSLPVAVATAAIGLYAPKAEFGGAALTAPWKDGGAGKYADEPILVIGGSSAVGQAVIQYAKLSGFYPIITTVSPSNNDLVTSFGATHPLDRNKPLSTLAHSIKAITSKPLTIIYDAIALSDTQNAAYQILAEGGTLIIVLLKTAVKEEDRVQGKEIVTPLGCAPIQDAFGKEIYAHLTSYLQNRDIKPNRIQYISGGLASIPDALDLLRKNKVSGKKLVVRPPETA